MVLKTKNPHIGGQQLALITPPSAWKTPAELPDLRNAGQLVIDIENRDDGLAKGRGSGWPYKAGHICGVAAAWPGGALYAPTRHPESRCLDRENVTRWLDDHFKCPDLKIIMHHASHDVGWLKTDFGLSPPVNLHDTEACAMLVDENRLSYRLDDLCSWRGVPGKDESLLREAAAAYGIEPKNEMYKLPARFVGPYAEADAVGTLALFNSLAPEIEAQGLGQAYDLERDLIPMCHEMRRRGVRINPDKAHIARDDLLKRRDQLLVELGKSEWVNSKISISEVRSAKHLEQWFDKAKIPYPRTPKTQQGSFKAIWMRKHPHFLPRTVARIEQLTEAADKFIFGFIIDFEHKGRLHATINQYRGEEGGTRSFRFSYSDPPIQQMYGRSSSPETAELTRIIRGLFEPEDGEQWLAADWIQQEYKLIVHFALLSGCRKAQEAADKYNNDPKTDFHSLVADMTGLDRTSAKNTNFAKVFGAGIPKFATMIGQSEEAAAAIMAQYDQELPFPRELSEICQRMAKKRGWIKLLDGARSHFDMWEPSWRERGTVYEAPRPRALADEKWPGQNLARAYTYKAMNRLIQGSAARQMKMAMRACWRENIVPLLQMHDELDLSIQGPSMRERVAEIMRDVVKLSVPMLVDTSVGSNWGAAKLKSEADDQTSLQ